MHERVSWEIARKAFPWAPQTPEEVARFVDRSVAEPKLTDSKHVDRIDLAIVLMHDYRTQPLGSLLPFLSEDTFLDGGYLRPLGRMHRLGLEHFSHISFLSIEEIESMEGIGSQTIFNLVRFLIDVSIELALQGGQPVTAVERPIVLKSRMQVLGRRPSHAGDRGDSGVDGEFASLLRLIVDEGCGNDQLFVVNEAASSGWPQSAKDVAERLASRSAFEWLVRMNGF